MGQTADLWVRLSGARFFLSLAQVRGRVVVMDFKTVTRHPVIIVLFAIWGFVLWILPVGISQSWPAFVKNKTIPEWLAENGWPSMWIVIVWLTVASLLTLVIVLTLIVLSRRDSAEKRVRMQLALSKEKGQALYDGIDCQWARDAASPILEWSDKVEQILREWKADDSYVQRFRGAPDDVRLDINDFPENNPGAIDRYIKKRTSEQVLEVPQTDAPKFAVDLYESLTNRPDDDLRRKLGAFLIRRTEKLNDFITELGD
jgi:hypothetical protein